MLHHSFGLVLADVVDVEVVDVVVDGGHTLGINLDLEQDVCIIIVLDPQLALDSTGNRVLASDNFHKID